MKNANNGKYQDMENFSFFKLIWKPKTRRQKKIRNFILFVIFALVFLLAFYLIRGHLRKDNPRIETINQSVLEMKKISEFCTAHYFGEVMIQDVDKKFFNKKKIIIIASGKIRAGFDLSKMETQIIDETTIRLKLPPVKILDIITNPSNFRTFSERGSWSHDRVTLTKNSARKELLELALEDKFLSVAEENGKKQLSEMFMLLGFKQVDISFLSSETEDHNSLVGDSLSIKASKVVK